MYLSYFKPLARILEQHVHVFQAFKRAVLFLLLPTFWFAPTFPYFFLKMPYYPYLFFQIPTFSLKYVI